MAPNSKINAKRKAKREAGKVKQLKSESELVPASSIPFELQQLLLNIFRNSFAERLNSDINPVLQEVKGHLYNRDFSAAFGKSEYLEAYAARWSPSRALGYADVFWSLREHFWPEDREAQPESTGEGAERNVWKVVCLGGGAGAEIVAVGGLQKLLSSTNSEDEVPKHNQTEVIAIDIADWNPVVEQFSKQITTAPPLSKYASAAVQAANVALLSPEDITVKFLQQDVFTVFSTDHSAKLLDTNLVTLMFTLNELYSTSISQTQKFLLSLTEALSPGSLLLVVDSPGSYSTITLNGAEKKYPMHWLLDHTLLKQATNTLAEKGVDAILKWEKIHEDESRWFRLDDRLSYPIELENMRMQLHLYRRL